MKQLTPGLSYQELVTKIEDRFISLSNLETEIDNRYKFLELFIKRYESNTPSIYLELKPSRYLFASLLEKDKKIPFDEIKKRVLEVKEDIDNLYDEKILSIILATKLLKDSEYENLLLKFEEMINLEKNTDKSSKFKVRTIYQNIKNELNKKLITKNGNNIFFEINNISDIKTFFNIGKILRYLNDKEFENMTYFLTFIQNQKKELEIREYEEEEIKQVIIVQCSIKKIYKTVINEGLLKIENYYYDLCREKKNQKRRKRKEFFKTEELLGFLKQINSQKEITESNAKKIETLTIDKQTKIDCLLYIYQHNSKYYAELSKQYNFIIENSVSEYCRIFQEFKLDFSKIPTNWQTLITDQSVMTIKTKLKLISKLPFDDQEKYYICTYGKVAVITKLNALLEKSYINLKFLEENIDIYNGTKKFENLKANIFKLIEKKVNLTILEEHTVLIESPIKIENRLRVLKENSLSFSNQRITELKMLQNSSLGKSIDTLVEVGAEQYLTNISILNSDSNLPKRILLTKEIDADIGCNGILNPDILDPSLFFIPDEQIKNYFDQDNSDYNCLHKIIFKEEDLNINKMGVEINGIIIPKARIKNLVMNLSDLIRVSLYSKNQIKKLEEYCKMKKMK